jgi:hypothetical protein
VVIDETAVAPYAHYSMPAGGVRRDCRARPVEKRAVPNFPVRPSPEKPQPKETATEERPLHAVVPQANGQATATVVALPPVAQNGKSPVKLDFTEFTPP